MDFLKKPGILLLKLVQRSSSHCPAIERKTYHKAVCRVYILWPSDPHANYQLAKFRLAQKAKFKDSFWV